MLGGALRLLPRIKFCSLRSAQLALCIMLALLVSAAGVQAQTDTPRIVAAEYTDPTTRYPHGVLGDVIEHGTLRLTFSDQTRQDHSLPVSLVFEDTAPRLADVDGDSAPEVIVVESHQDKGARLAVYNANGRIAATPYIGRRFRWLAPIGIADLDLDGKIEIAYIDRPHLAKTLRVWRFENGTLKEVAALKGLTNHKIGERDIAGGIHTCGPIPMMIVASADWRRIIGVTLENGKLQTQDLGPHKSRASFAQALSC